MAADLGVIVNAWAAEVVRLLRPYLPVLVFTGQEAAKAVIKHATDQGLARAKAVWSALHTSSQGDSALIDAAKEAAARPDDQDAEAVLRVQVRKLLTGDPELRRQVEALVPLPRQEITADRSSSIEGAEQVGSGGLGAQQTIRADRGSRVRNVRQAHHE